MISEVYNIDCLEYMKDIPDKYFDLAIVDPPYGLNIAKSGSIGRDKFPPKNWDNETPNQEYFNELLRISNNQIVWGWNYMTDKLPTSKAFIYWNKLNHHNNRSDGELAYCSISGLGRHFEYMWDGNRYGFKDQKIQGVGQPTIRIHPTEKPVALYKWLLKNYAKEGDKIFDSHLGSQSSRIACYDMGFDFWGCEIDPDYFKEGCERFEKFKSQLKLF